MEPQTLWRNRPLKTNILDIQFDNLTREEARQAGAELLRSSDFHYAVTPNPEFILTADKDLEFQKILNQADLVLPDGIGVVYSAKILGTPLKERVAGFDFACDMLDVLDEMGGRLYLLGSKPGVAEEAGRRILEQHPNIVLCGVHDGYFQDSDPVAHEVAQAQPDLLFVCLGAPKQEKWITRFGLLTGATLGGNLTPIGASANIAAIGILRKHGETVTTRDFLRIGVPFTLSAVAAGYLYLWAVWGR